MNKELIKFKQLTKDFSSAVNVETASFWNAFLPKKMTKSAERKVAVDSINGSFYEGEVIGVIGHNGAGKSTFLSMIAGTTIPSSGEMEIHGKVSAILTLGLGLREEATGLENIYIDGEIRGLTREQIDAYIDEVVAFSELGEDIHRPIRTYSTGMKSRLALSTIITVAPEILIIDEALGAGDINFARKASAKMREICRRGKLVIIVSHSMATIREMCNRCIWMDHGSIRMDGDPASVTRAYVDEVTLRDEEILKNKLGSEDRIEIWQDGKKRTIIDSQQPVEIALNKGMSYVKAVEFYSLDGIPLWSIEGVTPMEIQKMVVEPFLLGEGYYSLVVRLVDNSALTKVFEVRSAKTILGGRPQFNLKSEVQINRKVVL